MCLATTAEDQPYYISYFSAYEYPTAEDPSHDVMLVGLDDTVSRFLFPEKQFDSASAVLYNENKE